MQTARAAPIPIPAFAPPERVEDGDGVFVGVELGEDVVAPGEEVAVVVEVWSCPHIITSHCRE